MKTFMVIGSGPYCIGSSVEFDWCSVQVLRTLKKLGHKTVFINSNPETVSTDFDECDRLYFEELTLERVLDVYEKEEPDGVIFSTGGQVAQNLAVKLEQHGVRLVGTAVASIDKCEDREKFSALCDCLKIDQPQWAAFSDLDEAKAFAREVGYPVLVRPSFVLSGAAMAVAPDEEDLVTYLENAVGTTDSSVVISKFEENAKEIEFDAVAQDGQIIVSAVAEHLENAGVHSGDATIVLPAQRVYLETLRKVRQAAVKLAAELSISGPFNIQFLAKNNEIKVIECNLRASRSMPFASKVLRQNFMEIATRIWLGETLESMERNALEVDQVGVKAAQFSFSRLKDADPNLGVEMSSTGEVACFGADLHEAYLKSLLSVGFQLPKSPGKILLSLGKMKHKVDFVPTAKIFTELGFRFVATAGTAGFLSEQGIACETVYKISEDQHPNVIDTIDSGDIELVINTANKYSHEEKSDGYLIRRKAIDTNTPLLLNLELAKELALAMQAKTMEDLMVEAY